MKVLYKRVLECAVDRSTSLNALLICVLLWFSETKNVIGKIDITATIKKERTIIRKEKEKRLFFDYVLI